MRIERERRVTMAARQFVDISGFITIALVCGALLLGCVPPQQQQAPANVPAPPPASDTANSAPAVKASPAATAKYDLPITLPLLDAMLAEEDFVTDLKNSAGLTDDQVEQLRTVSREGVQQLSESDNSAKPGSTKKAVERAADQIRNALGEDKANQVFELMRQRYRGEGDLVSTKPNSIPTDTRIVVNAPEYRMDLFQNGNLIKSYKVAIGYPEFPLPTGLRRASTIIFNPKWTPPDEPWVKGQFAPGKTVEAGSKLNPLGPLKVPIGLPSLIHGGKNPAKLGTFGSHGCVGLTDQQVNVFATDLASLAGMQLTADEVRKNEADKTDTKEVKLQNAVPVELRYETLVVEDGKLHIYRDVYEHSTNTIDNLALVLQVYGVSMDDLTPDIRSQIESALNEMSADAQGNPVDEPANSDQGKNKKSKSDKVTRQIKGKKEIVIDIPQLAGKGYPAPVNLSER